MLSLWYLLFYILCWQCGIFYLMLILIVSSLILSHISQIKIIWRGQNPKHPVGPMFDNPVVPLLEYHQNITTGSGGTHLRCNRFLVFRPVTLILLCYPYMVHIWANIANTVLDPGAPKCKQAPSFKNHSSRSRSSTGGQIGQRLEDGVS